MKKLMILALLATGCKSSDTKPASDKARLCPACDTFCGPKCPTDDKGNCKACGKPTLEVAAREVSYFWCTLHDAWHFDKTCKANDDQKCCAEVKVMAIVSEGGEPSVKATYCPGCRSFCGKDCPQDDKGNCKACGKKPDLTPQSTVRTYHWCTDHKVWHDKPCPECDTKKCGAETSVHVLYVKR